MYKLKLSIKYKKFFFGLILYTPLLCDIIYAKEFCISNECKSFTSDLKFKTSRSYSNNLSYIKFLDNIFDGLLANNLESNNKTSQKELEVNITSDQQETSDDGIFKANGNVELETSNSLLLADKLQYDEKTGMLKIEGNIRYKRGEQYLEATKILFNTIDNEGFILNAYGSLEMDTITDDLDLNKDTKLLITKEDLLNENKLKDVGLKQSSNISLSGFKFENKNKDLNDNLIKKSRSYSLSTNFDAFASKWRFQSNKINIINNNWSAKKLILTNDPFNKPQTKINLYNFKTKKIKNDIFLTSRWSDLVLENKLIIPLGPRSVNASGINDSTWGIKYDKNDMDGFYLSRNFKTIKINNNENHTLKFQGQYFLQRHLQGKTKSFPGKTKLILDPKEEQDINFLDNFGIVANYQNKINDYDLNFSSSLNSLDLERWKNAIRVKSSLTKNLYFEQNNIVLKNVFKKNNRDKNLEIENSNIEKLNEKSYATEEINLSKGNDIYMHSVDFKLFGDYRDKTWLGSLGDVEIISAYGLGLEKYSSWVHNKVNKSSVLGFIYGDYLAGSYSNAAKSTSHKRFQSYTSRTHSYTIWSPEKKTYIDESYKYIPKRINRGLFFNATLGLNLYKYSNNQEQAYVKISGGPQLILGKYKRNFLDYTELGIYPNYTFSRGSTPFSFDQIVDKKYIQLVLKQQLYGPLAIKFSSNLNLDEYSKDYNKLTNPSVEVGWNRRSYNVELYYDIDPKVGGIRFNINGIGFKGSGKPFYKFKEDL